MADPEVSKGGGVPALQAAISEGLRPQMVADFSFCRPSGGSGPILCICTCVWSGEGADLDILDRWSEVMNAAKKWRWRVREGTVTDQISMVEPETGLRRGGGLLSRADPAQSLRRGATSCEINTIYIYAYI